jgi:hypothetical protein
MTADELRPHAVERMQFRGGYGEREVLWVKRLSQNTFNVLSTPIYVFGISPGATVQGTGFGSGLQFVRTLSPSLSATIRLLVGPSERASVVYNTTVRQAMDQKGLRAGSCTFLDPRIVAIEILEGRHLLPEIIDVFDGFVSGGVVVGWELADPDDNPPVDAQEASSRVDVLLVHPPLPEAVGLE